MVIKHKWIFKEESPWSHADEKLLALDTGGWRTERPVLDKSLCNYCGICAMYCPPQCMRDKGDHYEADLACTSIIPPGVRVLELGCATGRLLAATQPSY